MVLTSSPVSHLWIPVDDLDAAVRFYGDVLGFRLLEARPAAARFDANNLTLVLYETEDGTGPVVPTFRMEYGMDEFHAFLRERGAETKLVDMDFVGRILSIADPAGNPLWAHQPEDGTLPPPEEEEE